MMQEVEVLKTIQGADLLIFFRRTVYTISAPGMIAPQNKKCYITYDSKTDQYDTNEVAHGHYNGWH